MAEVTASVNVDDENRPDFRLKRYDYFSNGFEIQYGSRLSSRFPATCFHDGFKEVLQTIRCCTEQPPS